MAEVVYLSVNTLKAHQQNNEYFDDIDGDNYQNFKKSIENDGVITPIIVSSDMTIISGHQRVRACRELGIESIPAIIRDNILDDNDKLKNLIAANFGRIKNDPAKVRRMAAKYVELCGLKHGERQIMRGQIGPSLTLEEIAKNLGISLRALKRLLQIENNLIPEVKQLIDSNTITTDLALKTFCKLSKQEQTEFLKEVGEEQIKKLTAREVQSVIDDYNSYKEDYEACKKELEKVNKAKQDVESMKLKYKEYQEKKKKAEDDIDKIIDSTRHLKRVYEENHRKIDSQSHFLSILHIAIQPLRKAKADIQEIVKHQKGLDEFGMRQLVKEIDFLCEIVETLNKFSKEVKVEGLVYGRDD